MSKGERECYEVTKRVYARKFAIMEGIRQSLKPSRNYLQQKDVEQIETEVRERIRKQHVKREARWDVCKHPRIKRLGSRRDPLYGFCYRCQRVLAEQEMHKARERGARIE